MNTGASASASRFILKYQDVKSWNIDPMAIDDPDECIWLIHQLNNRAANIRHQIEMYWEADEHQRDYSWKGRAKLALRSSINLSNALKARIGDLKKRKKAEEHQKSLLEAERLRRERAELHRQHIASPRAIERAFVDVAKNVLPEDKFREILTAAMLISESADHPPTDPAAR